MAPGLSVDNLDFGKCLISGAHLMGLDISDRVASKLGTFHQLLLRWNERINLTSITGLEESIEKHYLDSLVALREVGEEDSVLDLGAGAGFPGIPWAIARPGLQVTLVDSVVKKVKFVKSAIASLSLGGVDAVHVRLSGDPLREGLVPADCVVSRAFLSPIEWVSFALPYVKKGGRIVLMAGANLDVQEVEKRALRLGLRLGPVRRYTLPFSRSVHLVLRFEV